MNILWVWSLIFVALTPACGSEDTSGSRLVKPEEQVDMAMPPASDLDTTPEMFMPPDLSAPPRPVSVETRVSSSTAQAGDLVQVSCVLLDEEGNEFDPGSLPQQPELEVEAVGDGLEKQEEASWQVRRVGVKAFSCRVGSLGLVDETAAFVEVGPGAAARVVTLLSERSMVAGDVVMATCTVFDAFGNLLPDAMPSVSLDKVGQGIDVMGLGVRIEKADTYTVTCQEPGATGEGAPLEVVPDVPAALVVGPLPRQTVYGIGQVVQVEARVSDRFDNVISSAPLSWEQQGGVGFGKGRFRFDQEGLYTVTTRVSGPTYQGVELRGEVQFLVNGTGPSIRCDSPSHGQEVQAGIGEVIDFNGLVSDTNGVATVKVNGKTYTTDAQGRFRAPLTVRYGINFVDISATDQFGVENSRSCAFLASQSWIPEGTLSQDAVVLKMRQEAVDDANPNDGIDSLNDVLVRVLNSPGLAATIDSALRAGNPLSDSCLQRVFGACAVSAKVTYLSSSFGGPHTSSMTLIRDGLRLIARVKDIAIRLSVQGKALGISYSITATGDFDYVEVDLTSDLALVGGRPRITLRRIEGTSVGPVSVQVNNVNQLITNLVVSLFQGRIKGIVETQIRNLISAQFNTVLDGIVSNLDVSSLGTTFGVPRLDGAGSVPVSFGIAFSSLGVSPARALFGIASRFGATVKRPGATFGAPRPEGPILVDAAIGNPMGVSVYVGVLNQVLHALWRADYFSGTVTAATLGQGLPAGVSAGLGFGLMPVVIFDGNKQIQVHIGAVSVSLLYPGLFDKPLRVELGATAKGSVDLQGERLSFGTLTLGEFYFSTPDVTLDETTRDVLEGLLKDLVQNVLDTSLNSALPTLPVPTFTLPATLSSYGLPPNGKLGLKNIQFNTSSRHVTLQGGFGIQ